MNLKLSYFSVVLALLFLGDPSSTTCSSCDTYTTRVGVLPDTTLAVNEVWKVNVKERLFRSRSDCDEGFDYFSPRISYEIENKILTLDQRGDTLYINPLKTGKTTLFLSVSGSGSIDPDILNQHLLISVD